MLLSFSPSWDQYLKSKGFSLILQRMASETSLHTNSHIEKRRTPCFLIFSARSSHIMRSQPLMSQTFWSFSTQWHNDLRPREQSWILSQWMKNISYLYWNIDWSSFYSNTLLVKTIVVLNQKTFLAFIASSQPALCEDCTSKKGLVWLYFSPFLFKKVLLLSIEMKLNNYVVPHRSSVHATVIFTVHFLL